MKKKKTGKKHIKRDTIITLVVVMVIIPAGIYFYNQQKMSQENNTPQGVTSGPFAIDKEKYRLGDYVFMVVTGLKPTDAGKMVVYDPKGGTFTTVNFNGTMKSDWNYMFKPNTERIEKLCTAQDLVGNWTIVFQGTSYKSIPFQVINEWVQGAEAEIKPVPAGLSPC
ncbi:MAG: hypothetical protein ACREA3_00130 [Nitrosotalea sp.]